MAEISLAAKKREISTKSVVNKLRREGEIPGVYYLKGQDPISFSVEEIALNPLVFTSETNIINLIFDGEEPIRSIIKDIQFDPVTDKVVHIDFMGVTLGQELQIQIPTNFVGSPLGVKEGGLLQEYMHKLDVSCLPRHIPESLEIDISGLNIGDTIHIRELSFENIKLLQHEDVSVVGVIPQRVIEEPTVEEEIGEIEETAEPEVIGKGKSEEETEE